MKVQSMAQAKNWENKTVFVRVDFNVPIKKGKIVDDFKIKSSLEDFHFLIERGAKIIVATHLGQPRGKKVKDLSTKPLAAHLGKLLQVKILFSDEVVGPKVQKMAKALKSRQVLFLENLRFDKAEQKNDPVFAKKLAGLADVYVNNAFAVCHREEASVVAIKKYLPSYAGLLLTKEIVNLNKVLKPKKPLVVVMGGKKISTKAPLIKKLLPVASQILLGGALANTFLAAKGLSVGKSLIDKDEIKVAKKLLANKKIIIPVDFAVSVKPLDVKKSKNDKAAAIRYFNQIGKGDYIGDIGPDTIGIYAQYLKKAQTIIWNGPMGYCENRDFKFGTLIIGRLIASRASGKAFGVAGGGETVTALKNTKMEMYMDWVSTGGGAMLEYLGGAKMPGLKGLIK